MNDFTYVSQIAPGQLINLLAGMKPDIKNPFSVTIREGIHDAVDEVVSQFQKDKCYFGPYPLLSPCETWSKLVSVFFSRFKVKGRSEQFSASAVLQKHSIQHKEVSKAIADWLGFMSRDLTQ